MTSGRIIATIGGVYDVQLGDGRILPCHPLGVFRHKKWKPMVGDIVQVDEAAQIMTTIEERRNFLPRPALANIDCAYVISALTHPDFSYGLTDKFLTMLNYYAIPCALVLTKKDAMADAAQMQAIIQEYQALDYKVYVISSSTKEGVENLCRSFSHKVNAFMGQTGVGKSSLLNAINPSFSRSTKEISLALGRGKHETKEVVLIAEGNSYFADTPGFSSIELSMFKEELAVHFAGFSTIKGECQFANCLHLSEKNCKIKRAVENGQISQERYKRYVRFSQELAFRKDRYK